MTPNERLLHMTKAAHDIKQAFLDAVSPLVETGELHITEDAIVMENGTAERSRGHLWWRRQVTVPLTTATHTTRIEGSAGSIDIRFRRTLEDNLLIADNALEINIPPASVSDLFSTLARAVESYKNDTRGFMYENDGPHLAPLEHYTVEMKEKSGGTTLAFNPTLISQDNHDREWLLYWSGSVNFLKETLTAEINALMLRRYMSEHKPSAPPSP